ncbi:MAG: transcriptional activator NhaR [Myxococcota bacterium]
MEWLNYHHLLYFWMVAREGSVTAAAAKLRLSQPTLSGQIKQLERDLGESLFERRGRSLALTEIGATVYQYADAIFGLGAELVEVVHGRRTGSGPRFVVGVLDALPKRVVCQLLAPALGLPGGVHLVCREGPLDVLLAALATHAVDLVLSDTPIGPTAAVRAFQHPLGECGVVFVAAPALAARLRDGFPASLDRAPMLVPADGTSLRRSLQTWFDHLRLTPSIVGEFTDHALLKAFGQVGLGAFAVPAVTADEVARQYEVEPIGRVDEVRERFYAITVDRRIRHPAALAIASGAAALLG